MANRIAEAFIELKTRGAEKVRAVLKGTNKDLDGVAQKSEKASEKVGKIGKAAEGLQSTLGKLLLPVAFVASLIGVVNQLITMRNKADSFRQALNEIAIAATQANQELARQERGGIGTPESIAQLRQTTDLLTQLQTKANELAKDTANFGDILAAFGLGQTRNEQIKELEELSDKLSVAQRRAGEIQQRIDERASERRQKRIEQETEALRVQLEGNDAERATLGIKQQIFDLEERAADARLAGREDEARALIRQREVLFAIERETLRNIRRAAREQERADNETAERQREQARETARIIAEANTQAAAQTRQALLDAVSAINSQSPAFSQLEDLVASIADEVRQIRGRTP